MTKLLLPVDGSPNSLRAVESLVRFLAGRPPKYSCSTFTRRDVADQEPGARFGRDQGCSSGRRARDAREMTVPASAAGTSVGRPRLRVLVPVDGSHGSDCAVRYVVELAWRSRPVEVLVLNVEPSLTYIETLVSPAQMLADYWSDSAGKQAARSACAILEAASVSYSLHLARGDPREAIGAFARRFECDLIVMGTRGMGGAANLVLGSVAAAVIQCADRPITLVKRAAQRMT